MKKRIILFLIAIILLPLTGCNRILTKEKLLARLAELYPETVLNECKNNELIVKEDYISISNIDESLRFDLTYRKGNLVQFVCKDYGFLNGIDNSWINEKDAVHMIESFQDIFLDKKSKIAVTDSFSGYETSEYRTFIDANNGLYLVSLKKGLLLKYFAND